jgi:hypothetical protein
MTEILDRRQFSIAAALAVLGGATMAIGCGGGGSQNPTSPNAPALAPGDLAGDVSGNHAAPHFVVITAAQLAAGSAVILSVAGGFHGHTLSLTAAEVARIAGRERVQKDASVETHSNGSDAHTHTVTFN